MTVTKANSTEQKNGFSIFPISEEKKLKQYLYVTLEPRSRRFEGMTSLPYREFLDALWNGEYRS
jgi:hypothetical protein